MQDQSGLIRAEGCYQVHWTADNAFSTSANFVFDDSLEQELCKNERSVG